MLRVPRLKSFLASRSTPTGSWLATDYEPSSAFPVHSCTIAITPLQTPCYFSAPQMSATTLGHFAWIASPACPERCRKQAQRWLSEVWRLLGCRLSAYLQVSLQSCPERSLSLTFLLPLCS